MGGSANCAALLTPPGAGAIAVVRLRGPDAVSIVAKLCVDAHGRPLRLPGSNQVWLARFVDEGETLDDVVVSRHPEDQSVDICTHGGIRIVERVLAAFARAGAEICDARQSPADFWPHANEIEREALEKLGIARTEKAVEFLAWQRTHLAAAIEEARRRLTANRADGEAALRALVLQSEAARVLIDGRRVAIVGPTNSGKSTLFNRLVGREAALVSPLAGTTRDWIEAAVEMNGVPISLLDTAGANPDAGELEAQAIAGSGRVARAADAIILLMDASQNTGAMRDHWIRASTPQARQLLIAVNKTDLAAPRRSGDPSPADYPEANTLPISAKTGAGVDELVRMLLKRLGFVELSACMPTLFTARQVRLATDILAAGSRNNCAEAEKLFQELLEGDK